MQKKSTIAILCLLCVSLIIGCKSKKDDLQTQSEEWLTYAKAQLENANLAIQYFKMDQSTENYNNLIIAYESMDSDIDYLDSIPPENLQKIKIQKFKIDSTKLVLQNLMEKELKNLEIPLITNDDWLIENDTTMPIYLSKGSTLYYNVESSDAITTKIYNADTRRTIKTYSNKTNIKDSLKINNTAIYLIGITTKNPTYVNFYVSKKVKTVEQVYTNYEITSEIVDAQPSDFNVKKIKGIQMKNIFDEPKKLTLRSQGKAFFSGSYRSVVAVPIPTGAKDLFYSLRISTNEGASSNDGKFCDNMNKSYHKIKILGLPLYESTTNKTSLIRELLNYNKPVTEEDAYCNLYVFTNSEQAKKFQEHINVSELKYDIDLSAVGTQSCNGHIHLNGQKTIYLGFENARFRYTNYLWLECISAVPKTEYYKTIYTVKED